jgi:hypothetical protein
MENSGDEKKNEVNEPAAKYVRSEGSRRITFFKSFEEAEEHGRKVMASHSPQERLQYLEELRKRVYFQYLDAKKQWKPMKHIITIDYAVYL